MNSRSTERELNVLRCGCGEPPPECIELRAGPLRAAYQEGTLRWIRLGEREVLRGIYVAVRDRNWGTVPARLSRLEQTIGADSFAIRFEALHRQGEVDFAWTGDICGERDGTVTFSMEGQARSTFLRNRLGFCVLHPIRECAGRPCRIETADGRISDSVFPELISPHQPFKNLRAVGHEIEGGLWAQVRFEGEVFETEDQRNWTDASFKTYGTPLELPFPVEVKQGTRIRQSVRLSLEGKGPPARAAWAAPAGVALRVAPDGVGPTLPELGLGMASHGEPLSERQMERLRALRLSHLRVDLDLGGGKAGVEARLMRAVAEARALGLPLELVLTLSAAPREAERDLDGLLAVLRRIRPPLARWLVFRQGERSTSRDTAAIARRHLTAYAPEVPLVGGTNAFFAELNRCRPPIQLLDGVCYSLNPQVHAFDDRTLVENLQGQAHTVASAHHFSGTLPIVVSPVTLRMRFNPNATAAEAEPPAGELPAAVDPRQMSLFGLAWTLGSLKHLSESGAASITYYETTGWLGVMEREQGSPLPRRFPGLPGAVFPLYFAFRDLGEMRGGMIVPVRSSDASRVDGLAVMQAGRVRLLLANMTGEPQKVRLEGLGEKAELALLDERDVREAMRHPERYPAAIDRVELRAGVLGLVLLPYAYARLDFFQTGPDSVTGQATPEEMLERLRRRRPIESAEAPADAVRTSRMSPP